MEHQLIIRTKGEAIGGQGTTFTSQVFRGVKGFDYNKLKTPNEKAQVMAHELNGLVMAMQDIIEFWAEKGIIKREDGYNVMMQFLKANHEEVIEADELFSQVKKHLHIGGQ